MKLFNNSRWGRNQPLRPGQNPLADQLIEENARLRRERNDWMREAEQLKRLVDGYEARLFDGDDYGPGPGDVDDSPEYHALRQFDGDATP